MRERYHDQRDRLVDTLCRRAGDFLEVEAPDQGMHLAAYLRRGLSDAKIEKAALDEGVVVRALLRLYIRARPRQGLILGFSGYPSASIGAAALRLAKTLRSAGG